MNIKSNISELFAGDNLNWVISCDEYKSTDGYSLKITLTNPKDPKIEFIADGKIDGTWELTKKASETINFINGNYYVFYTVYNSSIEFSKSIQGESINIKPNITTAQNFDLRSDNQKLLDIVRERIAGRITDGMSAFTINGRSVTLIPFNELLSIEKDLENKVSKELAILDFKKKGRTNRNKLKIHYTGINL